MEWWVKRRKEARIDMKKEGRTVERKKRKEERRKSKIKGVCIEGGEERMEVGGSDEKRSEDVWKKERK